MCIISMILKMYVYLEIIIDNFGIAIINKYALDINIKSYLGRFISTTHLCIYDNYSDN